MSLKLSKINLQDDIKYFKQFNIYETFKVPNICTYSQYNIDTSIKLNIYNTKIIDTIEGLSIEGQNLTGKKLIILGSLNINMFLYSKKIRNKVISNNFSMEFSTFIVIPKEINKDVPIELRYLIEDISIKLITKDSILISSTILLQFVDECT